jgi:poly-beta-1,6-N-acetyl-D-glucosamine synthase
MEKKLAKKSKYIILTAARNEEKNIEKTIQSVISQTLRPVQWIIVSDGSTDRTDEIIKSYCKKYKFISLIRVAGDKKHNFGSKVNAVNASKKSITVKGYSYIGILDADVSFQKDYFETLLYRFQQNPKLGLCGGLIYEIYDGRERKEEISLNSVAGAVQFFRTECFKQVGDFIPLKYGGEDAAAEITARMNSWEVRTFSDLKVLHNGFIGQASGTLYNAKYKRGICYYQLGYHPLFEIFRCIFRVTNKPVLIGSIIELYGYFSSYFRKDKVQLPSDTVKYLRKEQKLRLKNIFLHKSDPLEG